MRKIKITKKTCASLVALIMLTIIGVSFYKWHKWNWSDSKVDADVVRYCDAQNVTGKEWCYCNIVALKNVMPKQQYRELIGYVRNNDTGDVNYFSNNFVSSLNSTFSILYRSILASCVDSVEFFK